MCACAHKVVLVLAPGPEHPANHKVSPRSYERLAACISKLKLDGTHFKNLKRTSRSPTPAPLISFLHRCISIQLFTIKTLQIEETLLFQGLRYDSPWIPVHSKNKVLQQSADPLASSLL